MKRLYPFTIVLLGLLQYAISFIHLGSNIRFTQRFHRCSSSLYTLSKLTPLPQGISPFQKSQAKSLDVQGELRRLANLAMEEAIKNSQHKLLEIEFPSLIGGARSKTQFDDFDNIQELDANRDWAVEFASSFLNNKDTIQFKDGKTWLIFADTKECEIAKKEWPGQRYRKVTCTTIEAATEYTSDVYESPWGATMSKMVNTILQ